MVHGDDFLAVGEKRATDSLKQVLTEAYKVKCEVLGDGDGEVDEIRVLNRVVRRTSTGITIEADPRHAEMVIKDLELTSANAGKVPGSKEEMKRVADARAKIDAAQEEEVDSLMMTPGTTPTKGGSRSETAEEKTSYCILNRRHPSNPPAS